MNEYLIYYGYDNINSSHTLKAANKQEAYEKFTRKYGHGFDYIEILEI